MLEYRLYADGTLQAEVRRYVREDGSVKEQGPYWYFRYHENGKQKKLYLGRTENLRTRSCPEAGVRLRMGPPREVT